MAEGAGCMRQGWVDTTLNSLDAKWQRLAQAVAGTEEKGRQASRRPGKRTPPTGELLALPRILAPLSLPVAGKGHLLLDLPRFEVDDQPLPASSTTITVHRQHKAGMLVSTAHRRSSKLHLMPPPSQLYPTPNIRPPAMPCAHLTNWRPKACRASW